MKFYREEILETFKKLGKNIRCTICKENLKLNEKILKFECNHSFHAVCMNLNKIDKNICPCFNLFKN